VKPPFSDTETAHWSRDPSKLMAELGSGDRGLPSAEAAERLRRHGANSVEEQRPVTALRLLLRQFESPLVLILVFGALISMVLRDWVEASIILAIVLGSTLLGFAQEHRASAAVAARIASISACAVGSRSASVRLPARAIVSPS